MHIIFLIATLFVPRIVIVVLWFFSNWFNGVFSSAIFPVLGFIFTPYTTLWYSVVQNVSGGEWGFWQILFLVVAVMFDVSQIRSRRS